MLLIGVYTCSLCSLWHCLVNGLSEAANPPGWETFRRQSAEALCSPKTQWMCVWHGKESHSSSPAAWPPVSDLGRDLQGHSWQRTLHTRVYTRPWELRTSKTFYACLLCVTHSLQGEKRRSILTCSLLKMKDGGGLPLPRQRSFTVSPSLTKPWGESFHSSMMSVGSAHTYTQRNNLN